MWIIAYEQETTTRSDKDKKKTGGTKNTTTKYNKEASNKLRKTIGIQKTPKSGENHTNVAILRICEIIQSNKDRERTKKKNKYEEEIKKLQKTPGKTEITTISTQTHAKKERKKKTTTSRTTTKTKKTKNNKNSSTTSNNESKMRPR